MERALKERIIGAVILVVFVVFVVPIFLDGPPPEAEIVRETVRLPGQSEQQMQTQILQRDRVTPVPTGSETVTREPERQGVATVETQPEIRPPAQPEPEPESKPESAAPAAAATRSDTGMWAVQIGSFSEKSNAEKLAGSLRKEGFAAFLSKLNSDNGALHRVRIGPQANREAAEKVAAQLKKSGHSGQVVPHP